ncbi:hypothetical protein BDB00DRAFT_785102 [Zychaea mexicana]|uniref:uncharacterized protein n=1 Tax=Zychaea mexicana TaxID=64656 RepID=UPI0022FE283B|nr:uncharacterized protein BDB00DRAFT_785102 [Zychaea mexicana]KAI9496997.1 hypothetical protein BDB00DRAFT_785102 [Zychaea mexicana]
MSYYDNSSQPPHNPEQNNPWALEHHVPAGPQQQQQSPLSGLGDSIHQMPQQQIVGNEQLPLLQQQLTIQQTFYQQLAQMRAERQEALHRQQSGEPQEHQHRHHEELVQQSNHIQGQNRDYGVTTKVGASITPRANQPPLVSALQSVTQAMLQQQQPAPSSTPQQQPRVLVSIISEGSSMSDWATGSEHSDSDSQNNNNNNRIRQAQQNDATTVNTKKYRRLTLRPYAEHDAVVWYDSLDEAVTKDIDQLKIYFIVHFGGAQHASVVALSNYQK